jgi:DNA polymerase
MDKQKALDKIAKQIAACRICRQDKIGLPVPGEGNSNAKIVFIGEAPGKTEAKTGKPFVGRSGKLLRELIRSVGLDDMRDVYITSPVKYLPKHGTPTPAEIRHGRQHLNDQMAVIRPKLMVLMGSTAVQAVLEEKVPVLSRHGQIVERAGQRFFLTLHPAAALRFQKFKALILKDFKKLKKLTAT